MKTIAIYCDSLEYPGETFEKKRYWDAYADLLLLLRARGVKAYFVTDNASYIGRGIFTSGYTLADGNLNPDDMIQVPYIRADIVFNRGDFSGSDVPVINPPKIRRLGEDKIAMYEELGQYQPYSIVCSDRQELEVAVTQVTGDLIVIKKPQSCGGRDVYIGSREKVLKEIPTDTYPLLVQEFMDTSVGIPGLVEGVHDLRLEMGGGQVWSGYIREPRAGEYRANVLQGGSMQYLALSQIPKIPAELAKEIDGRFGSLPRFYAIDFANTPEGWKLIEINGRPGLMPLDYSDMTKYVLLHLADYLSNLTRKVRTPLRRLALTWSVSAARFASEYERALGVSVKRRADGRVVMTFTYPSGVRTFLSPQTPGARV